MLKILHLEDDERDAQLINHEIVSEFGQCDINLVSNIHQYKNALSKEKYDLILSDFNLPGIDGMESLNLAKNLSTDTPYIFVSGHIGEDRAIEAMKMGATDYVLKDKLTKLIPSIKRAIQEKEEKKKLVVYENVLKESERFANSALNSLSASIAILNVDGVIIFVNKAWREFAKEHSSSIEGLVEGVNYFAVCKKSYQNGSMEAYHFANGMRSVINNVQKTFSMEYEYRSPTHKRWFIAKVSKFEDDGPVKIVVSHEDITEIKQVYKNLEASEARFRFLTENSTDIISKCDRNGNLIYISLEVEGILGYSPAELIGTNLKNIMHKDDVSAVNKAREEAVRTKETLRVIYRLMKKSGNYIWFETTLKAIIDPDTNHVESFIHVSRDVTRTVDNEVRLINALKKAELSDKLKSEFITQVSHEIRTPLNIIVSGISILKEDTNVFASDYTHQVFDSVDNSCSKLIKTVDAILNMSELQLNNYNPHFKEIDVYKNILEHIIAEFEPIAKAKDLQLKCEVTTTNPMINCDEFSVKQIFENIIDNAIKFTLKGRVAVKIDRNQNDKLVFEVEDTGVGISDEFISRLFDVFSQEEKGYSSKYKGNGLGLALVKRYTELNNATVYVKSKKNVGSIFRVVFSN